MKVLIALAVLLEVFMTQTLANEQVTLRTHGNDGKIIQQTININNAQNVGTININAGDQSSTSVYDYNHNVIGFRVPHHHHRRHHKCYIVRMNRAQFRNLEEMRRLARERKLQHEISPYHQMQYDVQPMPISDRSILGLHVDRLCKGLPAYWAYEVQGSRLFAQAKGCRAVKAFILDASFCGQVTTS
ncbi:gastrokine-1-like [Latimeria chalumnae]|uniref:gastrokine-1-like n=1 Tax=Latimeria chalumnae TaxID=7897 RepID=UPI0003C1AD0B|nr:PREDICTED: gastrokine-1-like [Latimeria chalumnae]|eukprot:XP_006009706.1 PREDICTED: gastrokine-1-like [Latimeria chalumnae]